MPVLEVRDVHSGYGLVEVLHGVSLTVDENEIVALLGGNGAGKSTTLLTISGVVPTTAGTIHFRGEAVNGTAPHTVAQMGLAHVPEGRRLFPQMDVEENLLAGAIRQKNKRERHRLLEECYELFPRLRERRRQLAGSLSGGEQQMCAIARALMAEPELVVLDEPSLGLAPALVERTFETILTIKASGVGVLLVEQNAGEALEISDRAYVMEQGQIILDGPARDVERNEDVRSAYLGL